MGGTYNHRPDGLFPLTEIILGELDRRGRCVARIDVHDAPEDNDCVWGELRPDLTLTEGRYMGVGLEVPGSDLYVVGFYERGCSGGDAGLSDYTFVRESLADVAPVVDEFIATFG